MSTLGGVYLLWLMSRNMKPLIPQSTVTACNVLLATASAQVALGIATLLTYVPVELAAAHQAGSLTLLTASLYCLHTIRRFR